MQPVFDVRALGEQQFDHAFIVLFNRHLQRVLLEVAALIRHIVQRGRAKFVLGVNVCALGQQQLGDIFLTKKCRYI